MTVTVACCLNPKFGEIILEWPQRTYHHKVAMSFKITSYNHVKLCVGIIIHLRIRDNITILNTHCWLGGPSEYNNVMLGDSAL
jgi:hypothetical protein